MINEILHEIDDLESAVKELSKANHTPAVINAVRIIFFSSSVRFMLNPLMTVV